MMELLALWKPILLSAALVFVASSIIWMALPIHKNDYKGPGDKEEGLIAALRTAGLSPGVYYLPWCGQQNPNDPAVRAKLSAGPWALLSVQPGPPNMGKMLGAWFTHLLIVSVFVAYVAANSGMGDKAPYLEVFRLAGTTALLAHAGYAMPMSIWHGLPWSHLPGRVFDGVVYALLTAGSFAWLWPRVAAG
ncbi:MAG: hypothetical protein JNM07_10505 [Phycisphaerae bacterium]|nr:hypothetical protein [Phycisphaerae bacterium]